MNNLKLKTSGPEGFDTEFSNLRSRTAQFPNET